MQKMIASIVLCHNRAANRVRTIKRTTRTVEIILFSLNIFFS